jgi:hypothetical protein
VVAEQFEKMHSTEKIPLILGVVTSHNYCTVPVWPLHGFENIRNSDELHGFQTIHVTI